MEEPLQLRLRQSNNGGVAAGVSGFIRCVNPGFLWRGNSPVPSIPHVEKHFTATETVEDVVIEMADGLIVLGGSQLCGYRLSHLTGVDR